MTFEKVAGPAARQPHRAQQKLRSMGRPAEHHPHQ